MNKIKKANAQNLYKKESEKKKDPFQKQTIGKGMRKKKITATKRKLKEIES